MKVEIKGWVARNQEPDEIIFCPGEEPPTRMVSYWFCGFTWSYCTLPRNEFKDIRWEDEPVKVKVTFESTNH